MNEETINDIRKFAIGFMIAYIIISPLLMLNIASKYYHKGQWDGIYLANIWNEEQNKKQQLEPEINSLLYNGIYGWFCYDTSSYEPAIIDVKQQYIERGCRLISIDNSSVNRSYYIENGWD